MRCAFVIVCMLLWAVASPAHASPYEVDACGSPNAAEVWLRTNAVPNTIATSIACPAASGERFSGVLVRAKLGVVESAPGAAASWALQAPAGTSISGMQLSRHLGNRGNWRATIVAADGAVLEDCPILSGLHCERGERTGVGSQNAKSFFGLRTSRVEMRVQCVSSGPCANNPAIDQAWIAVYSAKVAIEDPAPPFLAPVSGSFTAGWQRGSATADVSASDASGIRTLRLVAGSKELASKAGACDYTRMQPCPASMTETFSFDTAQLPDGTHELKVTATDAADQPTAAVGTIRVDRNAPVAPAGLTVVPGADGAFALRWTNGDQGAASPIVAAHYAVCDNAPTPTCQAAQRVTTPVDRIVLPAGKYSLRVWLEDEAGNVDPARAATVAVDTSALRSGRVVDTNPPVLLPSGLAPSSRIKVTKARRAGSTLTLSGTIARAASARITAKVARTRSGKPAATARVTPRRGKWSVRLKLPRSLRSTSAMYLTLSYGGGSSFRKATLRRKLARSARPSGNTAVEFSIESGRR